ncbi:MAG: hypothetical protein HYU78_02240 [Rhodocyclales bacterium]|nr:hypothetical protein [Rhodocyclales bacterium]
MAGLTELDRFDAEVYRIETDTVWVGGEDGFANKQGKALTNRTRYLYNLCQALGTGKQPLDAMLTALSALATDADQMLYFTGEDLPALTPLTAFMRTVLATGDAAAARGVLDAVSTGELAAAVAALVDASPGALDTLNELAAALGDDPNFAATITNALALKAPLASPAFTDNPTAPTQAQFDNDTSLATTAFVRKSGLQSGGVSYYTANTALPLSDMGRSVLINFPFIGGTISMPSLAAVPPGVAVVLYNWGATTVGLAAQAGQFINDNAANQAAYFSLPPSSSVILIAENATSWLVVGGSAQLTRSPLFSASLSANGYQTLPNGCIQQWGTTPVIASGENAVITLPIAYPNAIFKVLTTFAQGTDVAPGGAYIGQQRAAGLTSITIRNLGPSAAQYDWETIGK